MALHVVQQLAVFRVWILDFVIDDEKLGIVKQIIAHNKVVLPLFESGLDL